MTDFINACPHHDDLKKQVGKLEENYVPRWVFQLIVITALFTNASLIGGVFYQIRCVQTDISKISKRYDSGYIETKGGHDEEFNADVKTAFYPEGTGNRSGADRLEAVSGSS